MAGKRSMHRGAVQEGAAPLHNLPQHQGKLVGRDDELRRLSAILGAHDSHLLTLTGTGGSGKTRLALELATILADRFAHGVWCVELGGLSAPELAPEAVASVLGIRAHTNQDMVQTLASVLSGRSTLLVLDNCEHLITACAELSDRLLRDCSGLRILATSREPLRIPAETTWRVMPLSGPDPDQLPVLEVMRQFPAVELFVTRAQAARPEFQLTDANAAAIAYICDQLDGLPLALELAAARVSAVTAEQLAERLDDVFHVLTRGPRTAAVRQQTLRGTLDWSYDLLLDSERCVLRRTSVFAGGWTLEAAERVCAGDGVEPSDVLDLLTQLVDKSLVAVDVEPTESSARYRLLEPIRQYAALHLESSPDAESTRRRHAHFYFALAQTAQARLESSDQATWLDRLAMEYDNLRIALSWANAPARAQCGLRLASALWRFWMQRGHVTEGLHWLQTMLAQLPESQQTETARILRATSLRVAGWLRFTHGDFELAGGLLEKALQLFRSIGNPVDVALTLTGLGVCGAWQGDVTHARPRLDEAMGTWRDLENPAAMHMVLLNTGLCSYSEGKLVEAYETFDRALTLARRMGNPYRVSSTLGAQALVLKARGELAGARRACAEGLHQAVLIHDRWAIANALDVLAMIAAEQSEATHGACLLGATATLRSTIASPELPFARADYARARGLLRSVLGEARYQSAIAAGGSLTLEDTIAYALDRARQPAAQSGTPRRPADPLTSREREVAGLLAEGLSNRQIAERLMITQKTAAVHVEHILGKLQLHSRWQVADSLAERA